MIHHQGFWQDMHDKIEFDNFGKIIQNESRYPIEGKILKKIERIPNDMLSEINDFISKMEVKKTKKDKILSYAGAWESIDEQLLRELTVDLITKRAAEFPD